MDLSGAWYNDLKSRMVLKVTGKKITGTYFSAVGQASGGYELVGYLDSKDKTPTLGWTVVWRNAKRYEPAVTVWCGQALMVDKEAEIDTMWLLTESTSKADGWKSTLIGKDTFRRRKPTEAEFKRAKLTRGIAS